MSRWIKIYLLALGVTLVTIAVCTLSIVAAVALAQTLFIGNEPLFIVGSVLLGTGIITAVIHSMTNKKESKHNGS